MTGRLFYTLLAGLFLMVSACTTSVQQIPENVTNERHKSSDTGMDGAGDSSEGATTGDGSRTMGLDDKGDLSMVTLEALDSGELDNVVYFDYDSDQVQDKSLPLITSVAEALVAHSERQLRLEGHADERGTREYNLALGERRAQAVRARLEALGVGSDQLDIVSYGEERPAVTGSDETSWQQNRRVELVIP